MHPTTRLFACNFNKLNHLDFLARNSPSTFQYLRTHPNIAKALFMSQPPLAQFPPSKPSGRIPDTHSAFFYGTLMALPILSRVLYGTLQPHQVAHPKFRITPALLPNHSRRKVKGVDYPGATRTATEDASKYIRGTLVEGLTAHDIWRLDVFEGDEYARLPIDVHVLKPSSLSSVMLPPVEHAPKTSPEILAAEGTGEVVKTQGYVFVAGEHCLEKEEWDYEEFTREKLSRWTSEEKEYVESDGVDPLGGRWWKQPGDEASHPILQPAI